MDCNPGVSAPSSAGKSSLTNSVEHFMISFYSYKRGKTLNNDVDIVISHPDTGKGAGIIKGLCAKFTKRLYELGQYLLHIPSYTCC